MLFDRITENENKMIQHLRNDASASGDFVKGTMVDNRAWLRYWESAKAGFLSKPFGDSLILSKRINTLMEDDELHDKMHRVIWSMECEGVRDTIIDELRKCNDSYDRYKWGRNNNTTLHQIIRHYLFSNDSFVSNIYEGETVEIKLPDGNMYKLAHGCKVMKAIGRLAKACGIADKFETVRLWQSQILNEARLSAELCLSIHPLDYMTASLNNNDWRSCMCWDDGEFRRGVIEMMNSPIVVVAYLKSSHEKLRLGYELEWNSKRWREFFIVSPSMITGIKGYPYWNRALEDSVLEWLRELYIPYYNEQGISVSKNLTIYPVDCDYRFSDSDVGIENIGFQFECGPAMYNDFYNGNDYHGYLTSAGEKNKNFHNGWVYIDYSGESECVICGGVNEDFDGESCLICYGCVETHSCYHCGNAIYSSEDVYIVNGREYCCYCYDNLPGCDLCDNPYDPDYDNGSITNFGIYIPAVPGDLPNNNNVVFDSSTRWYSRIRTASASICEYCAEKVIKPGRSGDGIYYDDGYCNTLVYPIDAINEEYLIRLFDQGDIEDARERIRSPDYKPRLKEDCA